jgi:hypothetical protein
MKKLFTIVLLIAILLCPGCSKPSTAEYKLREMRDSFSKLNAIKYKEEFKQDYWQTPQETQLMGTGDCEDQAIYLQKILKDQGWDAEVIFGKTFIDLSKYKTFPKEEKEQKIFLDNLVNELKVMHAWVEVQMKWTNDTIILDPTNGIFVLRSMLDKDYYVHIVGVPILLEKVEKYQDKNNVILNYRYNILVYRIKQQRENQQTYLYETDITEIKWLEEEEKPEPVKILDTFDPNEMPPAP